MKEKNNGKREKSWVENEIASAAYKGNWRRVCRTVRRIGYQQLC